MTTEPVLAILAEAKKLAQRYRTLTGRPLGITGEVAEYEAARILGVELTPARQAGYDATEVRDGQVVRLQIKGRCVLEGASPGQRMGSIDIKKELDAVLLVILDGDFEATVIYEAPREAVVAALTKPGSKSRNERGALWAYPSSNLLGPFGGSVRSKPNPSFHRTLRDEAAQRR